MGFWSRLFGAGSSTPRTSVTVANLGGSEVRSDGSMNINLPGPIDIDTAGRTSVEIGSGMSIRSDGSVNFNFSSFGGFRSSFDP